MTCHLPSHFYFFFVNRITLGLVYSFSLSLLPPWCESRVDRVLLSKRITWHDNQHLI
jgi:hypothetical protein